MTLEESKRVKVGDWVSIVDTIYSLNTDVRHQWVNRSLKITEIHDKGSFKFKLEHSSSSIIWHIDDLIIM